MGSPEESRAALLEILDSYIYDGMDLDDHDYWQGIIDDVRCANTIEELEPYWDLV